MYRALIDNQLRKAFTLVKDLADDATFTKRNGTAFDFGTGALTEDASTITIIKAVIVQTKKDSREDKGSRNTQKAEMMFKTADLGEFSAYDTVTIDGNVWNLGDRIKSDGYITLVEVFRES
jgi:hypothetical protein